MADNIDSTLTEEERQVIKTFRESHASKAERHQRFVEIMDRPVGAWSQDDYKFVEGLLPDLIAGKTP